MKEFILFGYLSYRINFRRIIDDVIFEQISISTKRDNFSRRMMRWAKVEHSSRKQFTIKHKYF